MKEPTTILPQGTRIRTSDPLHSTGGFLIREKHVEQRKAATVGAICGIVGGHGGDVYWVAHIGGTCMAAYGWMEFELEPAKDPCPACKGSGIDWGASHDTSVCTACPACTGTAERTEPVPSVSAWEHLQRDDEL